jgi:hypothetical protein
MLVRKTVRPARGGNMLYLGSEETRRSPLFSMVLRLLPTWAEATGSHLECPVRA